MIKHDAKNGSPSILIEKISMLYQWTIYFTCVFWRFLEISTRVVLLAIVWTNLGGITVFLTHGIELVYLTILSYALGTLDMMGNIVYLRAANSNTADKTCAQKATYLFWIYRVLSAYILLILSTIFATTRFDATHIMDYQSRNYQTLRNTEGFAIFLYCWIATPLWHWVGAIIVFDYKNLKTISRDIEHLAADGKWLDVWELVDLCN